MPRPGCLARVVLGDWRYIPCTVEMPLKRGTNPNPWGTVSSLIQAISLLLFCCVKGTWFKHEELGAGRTLNREITEVNESSHFSPNELLIISHLHIHYHNTHHIFINVAKKQLQVKNGLSVYFIPESYSSFT